MKNTKHTENLDNSTPQEITSQSKRKILTSIGVSSGIIGASAISHQWTKPIVNSIILPAHAHTTDAMGKGPVDSDHYHDKDNNGNHAKKPDDDDTSDDDTDDGDTDDGAGDGDTSDPMIMLSTFPASQLMGDSLGVLMAAEAGMRKIRVALSVMPTAPVTVTVGGGATPAMLTFDDTDYMENQEIMLPAADAPTDMEDEEEFMVTLTAKGGNYDEVEKEVTYTVGYFGPDPVSNVKVMVSNSVAPNGMAKVTWDEPKTRKEIKQYRVTVTDVGTGADAPTVTIDGETADITEMKTGTAMVTVEVIYADDVVVPPAAPARADKPVV